MTKAGGIIAIIAGIFGIFAAGATLFIGGVGRSVEAEGAGIVVGLGWAGILFSFSAIIFGALSINTTNKNPGVLLILTSLAGIVLGGKLVAIFMLLSLIGGILVTKGLKNPPAVPAAVVSID